MRENWTYKKLGEVCEVLDNLRKPVTKKDRVTGIYPYYGASGIQDYVDSYIFDGRYLLVGEDGAKWGASDKSAYIIEGKSWVNNHAHILAVSADYSDTFIEYYLTFKDLSQYITGAIVPKLTQKSLVSIPIPIPSLSEQQSIVAELDKINELISLKKTQLSDLDALAQSIFYDMFGDPIENEKGWGIKALGSIADFKNGLNFSKEESGNYYKFLGVSDFQDNRIVCSDSLSIIHLNDSISEEYLLQTGDIVFVRSNGSKELVGRNILMQITEPTTFSGFCIRCRLSDNDFNSVYLSFLLKAPSMRPVITNSGRGCNISNLNQKILSALPIIYPPLPLQQDFAKRIELIEQQKAHISSTIKDLETLLASRMQYWFD